MNIVRERAQIYLPSSCKSVYRGSHSILLGVNSRIPQNHVESDNMLASVHDLTGCIQKIDGDPFSGGASAGIYRGNYFQGCKNDVVQQRFIALVDHSRASPGRDQNIPLFFLEGRVF